MKYNKLIYKMCTYSFLLLASTSLYAQSGVKQKEKEQAVKIQLLDEKGKAIANAEIVVGEGLQHLTTNSKGVVVFDTLPSEMISISENGYQSVEMKASKLPVDGVVTLKESLLYASDEDNINLPYGMTNKRVATGDYIVLTSKDLERYPTLDLRNALAALVPGLIITENDGSTGIAAEETNGGSSYNFSDKVNESIRGGEPIYVIDNVPIHLTEMPLDPDEIETITVVKDIVGKNMYGPRAANGVVYIKTKRGTSNERLLKVNMEKGIQVADQMPGVATGAEYATINNIARTNSGLDALYSPDAIAAYKKNYHSTTDPTDPRNLELYYPSNDYMGMIFKDTKAYQKVNVSSAGGNDFAKYYAYIGYAGEGDNFAVGPDANYNRINVRSNLDMKFNEFVSLEVGVFGGLSIRKSPNYEYGSEDLLDFNNAIDDIRTVSPIAFPMYVNIGEEVDFPTFGVSNTFKENVLGNILESGYYNERGRTGSINAALNIDLSYFVPGLKSKTAVNIMTYNLARIGKNEDYSSYTATLPTEEGGDVVYKEINSVVTASGESKLHDYYFQHLSGYQQFSYDRTFGDHDVSANLIYKLSQYTRDRIENPFKEQSGMLNASYSYKQRYNFEGALTLAGTPALTGKNQYRYFPSGGVSWIASEEGFLKNSNTIDFLKLRAQAGVMGYLASNPSLFLYENKWMGSTSYYGHGLYEYDRWQGSQGTGQSVPATGYNKWKNPDLDWELIKEYTVGVDALLLDRRLSLTANYYYSLHDGQWATTPNLFPLMSGLLATPTTNFKATSYYGAEFYARYTDRVGDFGYSVAASVTLPRTKLVRYDEPNYRADYLRREGKASDLIYGYIYDGVFATDEEAMSVSQYNDAVLQAGDFKYVDYNKDGSFDALDMVAIGNSTPRSYYTLNIALSYKNFDLTVIADGKTGFSRNMSSGYYKGGWGDNNYSQYIVDNYKTNYPRLTYYKVNNNFLASDYWLEKGDYMKIQNVELAYNLGKNVVDKLGISKVRLFVRGANLATISNIEGLDPESLNAGYGTYPLHKTYTGGFNVTF